MAWSSYNARKDSPGSIITGKPSLPDIMNVISKFGKARHLFYLKDFVQDNNLDHSSAIVAHDRLNILVSHFSGVL
jgi:hypothetical protein